MINQKEKSRNKFVKQILLKYLPVIAHLFSLRRTSKASTFRSRIYEAIYFSKIWQRMTSAKRPIFTAQNLQIN
jgi:hypothetical protein